MPRLMDVAHDNEEVTRGQCAHKNARQPLDRSEQPPRFRQHHIAVANGRICGARKVEGRFGIGQASPPQVEQPPDCNLRQMEQEEPPDHAEQHPGDRPDARRRRDVQPDEAPQQHGQAGCMHGHGEGHQNARAEDG